jgi:hypothetical protein
VAWISVSLTTTAVVAGVELNCTERVSGLNAEKPWPRMMASPAAPAGTT